MDVYPGRPTGGHLRALSVEIADDRSCVGVPFACRISAGKTLPDELTTPHGAGPIRALTPVPEFLVPGNNGPPSAINGGACNKVPELRISALAPLT